MKRLPVDLTDHLHALAWQVGYDLDLDELDPTTGFRPDLVTVWALAGARHAGLTYAQWLLQAPIDFIAEQIGAGDSDDATTWHRELLDELAATRDTLDRHLAAAGDEYGLACRNLIDTGLGLVWPRAAATASSHPDPRPHQLLTEALLAAGFNSDSGSEMWTRTSGNGARATITIDGAIRLHARPTTGPDWQATFAMATPPAAILAAATIAG